MSRVNDRAPIPVPSARAVTITFAFGVLSTLVHYAHNFWYADDYPPVILFPSSLAYQIGIAVFWPVLTLWGAWGLRQYVRGRHQAALRPLAAWSLLGATSPGHFLGGEVPDVPAFAMFTISTDFAAGVVMLVLVAQAWSAGAGGRSSETEVGATDRA